MVATSRSVCNVMRFFYRTKLSFNDDFPVDDEINKLKYFHAMNLYIFHLSNLPLSPTASSERPYGPGQVSPGGLGPGRGYGVRLSAQRGRPRQTLWTGRGARYLQVRRVHVYLCNQLITGPNVTKRRANIFSNSISSRHVSCAGMVACIAKNCFNMINCIACIVIYFNCIVIYCNCIVLYCYCITLSCNCIVISL